MKLRAAENVRAITRLHNHHGELDYGRKTIKG